MENVVCEMEAIWSQPQCVKSSRVPNGTLCRNEIIFTEMTTTIRSSKSKHVYFTIIIAYTCVLNESAISDHALCRACMHWEVTRTLFGEMATICSLIESWLPGMTDYGKYIIIRWNFAGQIVNYMSDFVFQLLFYVSNWKQSTSATHFAYVELKFTPI